MPAGAGRRVSRCLVSAGPGARGRAARARPLDDVLLAGILRSHAGVTGIDDFVDACVDVDFTRVNVFAGIDIARVAAVDDTAVEQRLVVIIGGAATAATATGAPAGAAADAEVFIELLVRAGAEILIIVVGGVARLTVVVALARGAGVVVALVRRLVARGARAGLVVIDVAAVAARQRAAEQQHRAEHAQRARARQRGSEDRRDKLRVHHGGLSCSS